MRNKKKYICFLSGLIVMFSLIGCSSTSKNTTPIGSPIKTEVNKTITKEVVAQKENTASISTAEKTVTGTLKVSYMM
ncbi:hypothetical protein [Clostridium estertheticum]|uniref:hypothetical protein n=1 Tax=Clostridium estertheticum TaxID=238834 RepID=UPI001C0E3223|nr:hypothetical protein [Clostridium estertheticum]MBU3075600.1 hypothetical protein [Clostridium estertheticum]MBU3164818.1 hypothetical protein [Clostridium estertheticum]